MLFQTVVVLIGALCTQLIRAQEPAVDASAQSTQCMRASDCIGCMSVHPDCRWCISEPVNTTVDPQGWDEKSARCDIQVNLRTNNCPLNDILNMESQTEETEAEPPRDASVTTEGTIKSAIQLSPQLLNVTLRPKESKTITVKFRLAKDYPVDLYYLMDLSQSMKDDKDNIANLGSTLAREMRNITKDVRLGFGSFVDKVLLPYVSTLPRQLESPCTGCDSPYSFHHVLNLTQNVAQFGTNVRATGISGNLDGPEGGFDAMMQAIVCGKEIGWRDVSRKLIIFSTDESSHFAGDGKGEIGWREQSRKMLIFSTDAAFHSAGDGKLGGVVEPNDGLCHMEDGKYTHWNKQDYPSISQLASKIAEKRINVIFAVTEKQVDRYQSLSEIITGSVTGELESDSGNIVQLVKSNYQKISSTVTMNIKRKNSNKNFQARIKPLCVMNGVYGDKAQCSNLSPGTDIEFEIEIIGSCDGAEGLSITEEVEVFPLGLSESLTINATVNCACECGEPMDNSEHCSGVGTFECGICGCNSNKYGDKCECDLFTVGTDNADLTEPCRPPANYSSTELCLGRGDCICSKCRNCGCVHGLEETEGEDCTRYTGKYCQCNPNYCPKSPTSREVCGGEDQGACECDENTGVVYCDCKPGFTGESCHCQISEETCINPDTGVRCSDKGQCECGKCVCARLESGERYAGSYCELCDTCPGKCQGYKQCVQCKVRDWFGWPAEGPTEENCLDCIDEDNTTSRFFYKVQEIPDGATKCVGFDSLVDCKVVYGYTYVQGTNMYEVYIKEEQECITRPNLMAIILGVIGGVVFIGIIALLIWKLITTIHDRHEFDKFEKDQQAAKWESGDNPLYVEATSTFKNPMYQKVNM